MRRDGALWRNSVGETGRREQGRGRAWRNVKEKRRRVETSRENVKRERRAKTSARPTSAEGVWTELLAHLVDQPRDDSVALGLDCGAGGLEQGQLALAARSNELRQGDPEQARGNAPRGAEPRQQLARHGVHRSVRLDGVAERAARL